MERDTLENWVDEAVMGFVVDMKYKLRLNNHKGHWKDYALPFLLEKLDAEIKELKAEAHHWSTSSNLSDKQLIAIIHECADVANFVLMIADNAKRMMRDLDRRAK